jgi:hypothetical protein
MDELELLARRRPQLSPEASTVERHRAQLRAAIAASSDSNEAMARHRPRRRWLVAAAVVGIAVAAAGAWLVTASSTAPRDRVSAPPPSPSSLPPVASASGICGESLPVRIVAPPGFVGPIPGPSQDATVPPAADQLVEHWTSPTGSIEVRWPLDADGIIVPSAETHPGSAGVIRAGGPDDHGFYVARLYFDAPPHQLRQCQVVQVIVRDPDPARAEGTYQFILEHAFDVDRRLVTDTTTVDKAPSAITCAVPAGTPPSPNRGGPANTPNYPTPIDALHAFVAADETLPQFGYTELQLPDRTTAYGAPAPSGAGFVIVIHLAHAESGWSVDWWDASGC